jgi:glucose/arabinose dehydrogenase
MSPRITGGEPRLITGICFDPAAPVDHPVLWVSHGQLAYQDAEDFTGKVSRLSGTDLDTFQDMIFGLPRASRDHLNNQLAFGPDGAHYLCQASNSAMGAPDPAWGMRPEHMLNAAILRIRTDWLGDTALNVRTNDAGGKYDPYSAEAPLTIYARGIRNCYDLLWHSDGQLYAPVNGSSACGSVPPFKFDGFEHPGMANVRTTEADTLIRIEAGAYYGHPVLVRGESILDGGNPTADEDPFEIPQYPVGTMPDPKWRLPVFDFGKHLSPCGLAEYKSGGKAFAGALDGKILVTRYSGGKDIIALTPGGLKNGFAITEALAGIDGTTGLNDPLDVVVDSNNGNVYVAEFGGQRLTLLRPRAGISPRVYRQQPLKTIVTSAKPATAPTTLPAK